MNPKNLFECLDNPLETWFIATFCILIFADYVRICGVWQKAARRYSCPWYENPWTIQTIVFLACGTCGYLTVSMSVFWPTTAYALKAVLLLVLKVADELFLKSAAMKNSLFTAGEAQLGRAANYISQGVREGRISKMEAFELIQEENQALIKLYEQ